MKYVIMCGGSYSYFKIPKQLTVINGERLVDRTIRLLREAGAEDIAISATDPRFDTCGVPRLIHGNGYQQIDGVERGFWLDAFYPHFDKDQKVTYIFGDVYFTPEAIKTIVNYQTDKNVLFGTSDAKNEEHQNWGEPFAYIVNRYKAFLNGIDAVKRMQVNGELKRPAIVWELYRYLNNLDVNVQAVLDETYVTIDDGTIDIDRATDIEKIRRRFECS